ncbi:cytochrome P450 [Streptomyces sp. NPDC048383]|uniref:cytochrome P450 n=1 Tax=Streptomyces sp. NPDC048383 TaxID=3155386 RepID=UPI0034332602
MSTTSPRASTSHTSSAVSPARPAGPVSPVDAVRLPDPYPCYAQLVAERPFAHDEALGAWVAADAAAVRAVLGSDALRVRPVAEPVPAGIVGTPAGEVFGDLVRMTDGPVAARLKAVVAEALGRADTAHAARLAARHTREVLAAGGEVPYEELMFGVPARVVAELAGLTEGAGREAARAIGDFVQCIPASATPAQQRAAATAAARLRELLAPPLDAARAGRSAPAGGGPASGLLAELVGAADRHSWPHLAPLLSNAVGFLSQTYDATAGLIGNTLVALARGAAAPDTPGAVEALVREVVRYDAPIQNTRRFAAGSFVHAGREVEPGQQVLVVLAAANRDPAVNPDPDVLSPGRVNPAVFTFGAAAHRCPGEELAVALAGAVVTELRTAGLTTTATPAYRPLANARIPLL